MKMTRIVAIAAALATGAPAAFADESAELIIDGQTLVTRAAPQEGNPLSEVLSGWLFRTDETQALQTDDFVNPAFVFVEQAAAKWDTPEGSAGKACASCHGEVSSLKGAAASMPKWNATANDLWSLENYVNDCRVNRMGAEALKWDGEELNAMTALISLQSRSMPVAVSADGPAHEWWERGKEMYYTRYGQLELACSNCHEDNYDNYIRADHLSQGQTNGFPVYRIKDSVLTSAAGRFVGCVRDTKAETYKIDSPEFVALELYVASRGQGLSIEGVAVRP